jgi:hypothetical protein
MMFQVVKWQAILTGIAAGVAGLGLVMGSIVWYGNTQFERGVAQERSRWVQMVADAEGRSRRAAADADIGVEDCDEDYRWLVDMLGGLHDPADTACTGTTLP